MISCAYEMIDIKMVNRKERAGEEVDDTGHYDADWVSTI